MRKTNERNPSTNRRGTAEQALLSYTAEQRETVRRGLCILARIIVRSLDGRAVDER